MKRLLVLVCACILLCFPALAETINLESMTFDELTALKASIEEEMKTRNVKKLDFASLTTDELQALIVQSLLELCSRESFVADLSPSNASRTLSNLFGRGAYLVFRDTKENFYSIWLNETDIELLFLNSTERILQEVSDIQIPAQ